MNTKIKILSTVLLTAFATACLAQGKFGERLRQSNDHKEARNQNSAASNNTQSRPDPLRINTPRSYPASAPAAAPQRSSVFNQNRRNPVVASNGSSMTSRGYYNGAGNNTNRGYYSNDYNRNYRNNYYGAPRYHYYYGGGYHQYPHYYRPFSAPQFGVTINVLPRGYHRFRYNRNYYYYSAGNFYSPYNGYYRLILPPLGARIPVLPYGAYPIVINDIDYYEYNGTYYRPYGSSTYEVVGQNGYLSSDLPAANDEGDIISDASIQKEAAALTELPQNYKTVTLNNIVYYVSPSGEYYVKNIDEKGTVTYTAVALETTGN